MNQYVWFGLFWGFVVALAALECGFSAVAPEAADRTRRWPTNLGMGVVNGAIASLLPVATVAAAHWAQQHDIGLLNWSSAPAWLVITCTVVVRSLAQYAFHRLAHRVPLLWSFHQVHHCDVQVDASTGLRFHPLEMVANVLFLLPIVIVTGMSPWALAAYEIIEILLGILTHTSLRMPALLERNLRHWIVTPALHRLHHSDISETDTNYGTVLVVWDRLFGTYCPHSLRGAEQFRYGLVHVSAERAASIGWTLAMPFRYPARQREDSREAEAPGRVPTPR